jgi:hypothetical protein
MCLFADHPFIQIPQHKLWDTGRNDGVRHTVCGRAGGWNYLMAVNPVAQAAYRTRAYAAAELPTTEPPLAPPPSRNAHRLKVLVVDRGGLRRSFLNKVCR